jgi:hypothetical protein
VTVRVQAHTVLLIMSYPEQEGYKMTHPSWHPKSKKRDSPGNPIKNIPPQEQDTRKRETERLKAAEAASLEREEETLERIRKKTR